ncbi:MAG: LytR C-terminal domain-containing protein [Ignavibacteriales bacterium]|nr:LytR C-terminal domain-containing protein [Ignavibacteriales bacterium]
MIEHNESTIYGATIPARDSGSSSLKRDKKSRARRWTVVVSAVCVLFLVVAYLFAHRESKSAQRSVSAADIPRSTILIEVVNGAGGQRLGQRFADYLRLRGFDVVDILNAKVRDVERTIVIDRVGNTEVAKQVAEALGIEESRVHRQIDKSLYLDVTVLIGRDSGQLKRIP